MCLVAEKKSGNFEGNQCFEFWDLLNYASGMHFFSISSVEELNFFYVSLMLFFEN
jgi:hypothetical protein